MADEKKDEAPTPAPVTEGQTSSGPAVTNEDSPSKTAVYYLRPGMVHTGILRGERVVLDKAGDTTEMTPAQYAAFSDKFMTKEEYEESKADGEEMATGASAPVVPDPATMEQPTIEASQNAANEPVGTGKNASTSSGEKGAPPAAPKK